MNLPVQVCCLYAFVVDGKTVRYIGLTDNILVSRLDQNSYGNQSTNKRVRQAIAFELKRGKSVAIYGRSVPEARLLAEERRLISYFDPAWNVF